MSEPFVEQFMEDFYAESDEHLATLRRVLLGLEGSAESDALDEALAADLFRALHTLKGLSGMVGFGALEQLAHALEHWFRMVLRRDAPLSADLVATAFEGFQLLERLLAARRAGTNQPAVAEFVERIHSAAVPLANQRPAPSQATQKRIAEALTGGRTLMQCVFVPSAELTEAGVTVERVRAALAAAGDLLEATPRVLAGGVEFHFVVALPRGVEPDVVPMDGLLWAPYEAPQAPSAQAPAVAEPEARPLVRVDLARLDELMRQVGDLVLSRSRLDDALRRATAGDAARAWEVLQETNVAMERQLRSLRESVMRARLVPFNEVFARLKFAARDLARESGKRVLIELEGEQTEIDKLVVDRMLEPLLHIVRNAVSHGLETPEERYAAGKAPDGQLRLRAAAIGDRVRLEVADDGRGIDRDSVARRARAAGLIGAGQQLLDDALLDVLCTPGFSTRDAADLTSGRGIGMAVARATVKELGGEFSLSATPGAGTRFQIELPLTLMIVEALLMAVGPHLMAIPMPAVQEILQVEPAAVTRFENNEVISYRKAVLPLLSLRSVFGAGSDPSRTLYVLVIGSEARPAGLVVDRVIGSREIVVRPIDDPLITIPGIAGATELSDGRLVLILDPGALARLGQGGGGRRASRASEPVIGTEA